MPVETEEKRRFIAEHRDLDESIERGCELMNLPQLEEQHGYELVPAVKAFGASIGSDGLHGFKELASRK